MFVPVFISPNKGELLDNNWNQDGPRFLFHWGWTNALFVLKTDNGHFQWSGEFKKLIFNIDKCHFLSCKILGLCKTNCSCLFNMGLWFLYPHHVSSSISDLRQPFFQSLLSSTLVVAACALFFVLPCLFFKNRISPMSYLYVLNMCLFLTANGGHSKSWMTDIQISFPLGNIHSNFPLICWVMDSV